MAKEDIRRIDFEIYSSDSDGKPLFKTEDISILFNKKIISSKEVQELIKNGSYERDDRIIVTTPKQANILKGVFDDEILRMYEYKVYQKGCCDYYTMGYIFSENKKQAKILIKEQYPNDEIYLTLENKIANGTILKNTRLD